MEKKLESFKIDEMLELVKKEPQRLLEGYDFKTFSDVLFVYIGDLDRRVKQKIIRTFYDYDEKRLDIKRLDYVEKRIDKESWERYKTECITKTYNQVDYCDIETDERVYTRYIRGSLNPDAEGKEVSLREVISFVDNELNLSKVTSLYKQVPLEHANKYLEVLTKNKKLTSEEACNILTSYNSPNTYHHSQDQLVSFIKEEGHAFSVLCDAINLYYGKNLKQANRDKLVRQITLPYHAHTPLPWERFFLTQDNKNYLITVAAKGDIYD